MDFKEVCEYEQLDFTDYIFYAYLIIISIIILLFLIDKKKFNDYFKAIFSQKSRNYDKNSYNNEIEPKEIINDESQNIYNRNNHIFNNPTSVNINIKEQFGSSTSYSKDTTQHRNKKNKNDKKNKNQNRSNNQNHNNSQNPNNNQIYNDNDNNNENRNNIQNINDNDNNIQNINNDNNENESDNNNNNVGYLIMNFEDEPKIGLANIGATCYMNATLQCFSHTTKLTNYYLAPHNKNFVTSNEKKFSREYYEVLKNLWKKKTKRNKSYYSPDRFKATLSKMEPLFEGIAANDSKDLVNFILQTLHAELNKANGQITNDFKNLNQLDEQSMLNYFLQEFQKSQKSIISGLFFGITQTRTECCNCLRMRQMRGYNNHVYVNNFQIMNFIIFPLEEVRKYKYRNYNFFYMGNSNEVNLSDCFDYFQKVELMDGENQMWCNYCNSNSASYYSTTLYSSPEILILILNRGKGNIYDVKLNFSEIINIGKYVKMKVNKNLIYHLYAIVTHIGPSSMSGHFIAFCKSPINGEWYKFNDAIVDCIGNFNNNVSNFGTPYILFYERQTL